MTAIAKFEFREGSYVEAFDDDNVTVSGDADSATWTSETGIDAIVVFGGNDSKTITFDEDQFSGTVDNSGLENEGGETPAISHITFCVEEQDTVSLSITKTEEGTDETLEGADFELYRDDGDGEFDGDDTLVRSGTTDENGALTFSDLDPDPTYWLVETQAPDGYEPVDEVREITFPDRQSRSITVENAPEEEEAAAVSLTVTKIEEGDTETTLEGADFELYLDDGDDTFDAEADSLEDSGTTGEDGTLTFSGLTPNETYFVVETDAPENYEIIGDGVTLVEIGETNESVTVENAPVEVAGVTVDVELVKSVEPDVAEVGDVVTYTYTFTNDGNVDVTDVELTDDVIGAITLPAEADPLEPGETVTVEVDYTVDAADVTDGEVHNVAVLTGDSEAGAVEEEAEAVLEIVEVQEVVEERDDEAAVDEERDELALTGTESNLAIYAAAFILGGAMLLFSTRQRLLPARASARGSAFTGSVWTARDAHHFGSGAPQRPDQRRRRRLWGADDPG